MTNEDGNALLPGAEMVEQGLADLAGNRVTELGLLVLIAGPRLRRLGIPVPTMAMAQPYEHELFSRLEERLGSQTWILRGATSSDVNASCLRTVPVTPNGGSISVSD